MVTLENRLAAVRLAIKNGASTVKAIEVETGIPLNTIYSYSYRYDIELPRTYLPRRIRLSTIRQVIKDGAGSVDAIAEQALLHPGTVRQYARDSGIVIPKKRRVASSNQVRVTPERDELVLQGVEQGSTLQEIGASLGMTREGARLYLQQVGMHGLWKERRNQPEQESEMRVQLLSLLRGYLHRKEECIYAKNS